MQLRYRFPSLITKDIVLIILFVSAYIGIIFKVPWHLSFLIALILLAAPLININFNIAVIFLILLIPLTRFPGITEYVEPAKYAIFSLILFFWFAKKGFRNLYHFKSNPLTIFFISFSALILLNFIFSINTSLTLKSAFAHIIAFGYFYLFLDVFQDREYLKKAIYLFIFIGVFVGSLAIIQYLVMQFKIFTGLERFILPPVDRYSLFFGAEETFKLGGYRSVGTFYHPNLLGLYLSMVLPLDLCFMALVKSKLKKAILGIFALIVLGGVFCSGSRGTFLNIIVSSVFLLAFFWRRIPKSLVIAGVVLFILLASIFFNEIASYLRLGEVLSYRNLIWSNSLEMIREKPLFGCGLGTFYMEYLARYGFPSVIDLERVLSETVVIGSSSLLMGFHAHNLFLNYASEIGIFASFLILMFYFIYFKKFISMLKLVKFIDLFDYALIIACAGAIAGNFIHSFFESTTNFYNFSIAISFIFITSIGMSLISHDKLKSDD